MAATVSDAGGAALPPRTESSTGLLARDLRKAENNETGLAIAHAQELCGWSLKEFAAAANRGERQIARWIEGKEHPQLDTLFAIESFRKPLIVALAKRAGLGVDVQTTITIREAA